MSILHFPDQVSSQLPISGVLQLLCGSLIVQEGLHVDQQPWTHFDDISTFDTSSLMPCTGSSFSDSLYLADYVRITGDTEGVDSEGALADSQIGIVVRSFVQ